MKDGQTFHAHIIFSTKGWQPVISDSLMQEIYERLKRNFTLRGSKLLLANGWAEHIHLLGKFSMSDHLSRIVGWSKGECSYWINRKYPNLDFYWQKGFWHERVPEDKLDQLEAYIKNQATIHEQLTFSQEITKFRKGQ